MEYMERFRGFNSPMIAIYHYSAATGSNREAGGILSRRPLLTDIYVIEYNSSILKAFCSPTEVSIRNGFDDYVKIKFQYSDNTLHWSTSLEVDEKMSSFHQEVSLAEAFTLHDKKFVRSNTSNPVEFVCAVEKRKRFFKKVSSPTDKLFLVPQTGRSYEQQLTNIERFFLRSNSIQISLAEFIMLYDFCGF